MSTDGSTDDSDLKRVTVDGETVERFTPEEQQQQKVNDLNDQVANKPHFGMRASRIVPPGCG